MQASHRQQTETDNYEVARILDEVGDLLELQGENLFRIRAYRSAARLVRELGEPLAKKLHDPSHPLTELAGIGRISPRKSRPSLKQETSL